ncbi:SdpI family protein [uncultured Fenollaria sp.]|uniref:SdpI family protein n=1 Tax=uncultured Fenollaria sp. TaxID=1686315 RepID=UPI0025E1CFE9|nr:SdpI family protein [uncultured Fenollaria sp.]
MFKIIMLISVAYIPLFLIVIGKIFEKYPSKEPNIAIGFRTKLSMMNKETWDYAQRLFPKAWISLGRIMLPISLIILFLLYSEDKDYTGNLALILMMVQVVLMLGSILYVNLKLKAAFNSDGSRKEIQ